MKKREPVSKIMTKSVKTIDKTKSLHDAIQLIKKNHIRHLPVMQGEKVVGMISSTDLNRLAFGSLFDQQEEVDQGVLDMLSIEQVMTDDPKTVNDSDPIQDVAYILSEAEYHALPVINGGEIVGIVTTTDLIKYLLEQY